MFSLIDGHSDECVPKSDREEEEFRLTSEGSETGSATLSYVDSLLREDCRSGQSPPADAFEDEIVLKVNRGEFSGKVPDVLMGSPDRVGIRIESERFQSATDVHTCPYDVSFFKRQNGMESGEPELVLMSQPKKKTSYSFMEDEDEIKV